MKPQFAMPITLLILLALPLRSRAADPPLIQTILDGTAAYCDRLEHAAFRFTCLERVKQRSRRWGRHDFVYDYQVIKEGEQIRERRILKQKDGESISLSDVESNRRFSAELFSFRAALAPIYLFGADFSHRFRFAVTGKRNILGRPAWEVTVFRRPDSPLPAPLLIRKQNNQAGLAPAEGETRVVAAWIDREDFSVLGFQVYPAGIASYNGMVEAAFRQGLKVKARDIHIFGLLREGIRYPTRTEITLTYSPLNPGTSPATGVNSHVPGVSSTLGAVAGRRTSASEIRVSTEFTYTNHRFFTARSADPLYPDLE
ncbi:MAG: hypothetical protein JXA62_03440 [Candidatus Aminicenantes bacterium]|nr:hypothetical protein [Candidatus Aminicenantes bacterium]